MGLFMMSKERLQMVSFHLKAEMCFIKPHLQFDSKKRVVFDAKTIV